MPAFCGIGDENDPAAWADRVVKELSRRLVPNLQLP